MREKTPLLEVHDSPELLSAGGNHELAAKASAEKSKEKLKHNTQETAKEARQALREIHRQETAPNPLARLETANKLSEPMAPNIITRQMQKITKQRELKSIRRKLPVPQRALSRVIHQPVISTVSEAAGKTISRPSGLLGGGLVAFLGSSAYVFLTYHIGFKANPIVFLLLFVGGFTLGVLLELLVHLFTSRHRVE